MTRCPTPSCFHEICMSRSGLKWRSTCFRHSDTDADSTRSPNGTLDPYPDRYAGSLLELAGIMLQPQQQPGLELLLSSAIIGSWWWACWVGAGVSLAGTRSSAQQARNGDKHHLRRASFLFLGRACQRPPMRAGPKLRPCKIPLVCLQTCLPPACPAIAVSPSVPSNVRLTSPRQFHRAVSPSSTTMSHHHHDAIAAVRGLRSLRRWLLLHAARPLADPVCFGLLVTRARLE